MGVKGLMGLDIWRQADFSKLPGFCLVTKVNCSWFLFFFKWKCNFIRERCVLVIPLARDKEKPGSPLQESSVRPSFWSASKDLISVRHLIKRVSKISKSSSICWLLLLQLKEKMIQSQNTRKFFVIKTWYKTSRKHWRSVSHQMHQYFSLSCEADSSVLNSQIIQH